MLELFGHHLGVVAGIIVSLGVICTLIYNASKIWTKFKDVVGKIACFFIPPIIKDIRNTQLEWHEGYIKERAVQNKLNEDILEAGVRRDEKIDKIVYALWNNGSEGMVHQVGRLAAVHKINFEHSNYPQFECDRNGINLATNEPYRILAQVWSIDGITWQQVAYGDLLENYVKGFNIASSRCEDFIGEVDFREPTSGKHRGRWKIQASAVTIGDKCLYYGRFILAIDDVAKDLVREYGWDVKIKDE